MNGRIWYPQLDVYCCIRRLGGLLLSFEVPPSIERMYIADFYFANPPLLYRCTMSRETRSAFSALAVVRPDKSFLQFPAAPLLFGKMEPVQKEALRAMAGKGIVSMDILKTGIVELSSLGSEVLGSDTVNNFTEEEVSLIRFLTADFAAPTDDGVAALRRRTGIRGVG